MSLVCGLFLSDMPLDGGRSSWRNSVIDYGVLAIVILSARLVAGLGVCFVVGLGWWPKLDRSGCFALQVTTTSYVRSR